MSSHLSIGLVNPQVDVTKATTSNLPDEPVASTDCELALAAAARASASCHGCLCLSLRCVEPFLLKREEKERG